MNLTQNKPMAARHRHQLGLLPEDFTWAQEYECWKVQPGARELQRIAHALTARFVPAWKRQGRRVSVKLVWEQLRYYHLAIMRQRKALDLPKKDGFTLNNNFTAYLARDIMRHRPEWEGIFETRETGREHPVERTTVVRERIARPALELVHA